MDVLKECRERLIYDPLTGIFVWKATGKRAGGLDHLGYELIGICGKKVRSHRIAWGLVHGDLPVERVDHINGNRADNRIENLRLATNSQNMANRAPTKANTSGFKGVSWNARRQKWQAHIMVDYKSKYLGLYFTAQEASAAYEAAAREHFGEFARAA